MQRLENSPPKNKAGSSQAHTYYFHTTRWGH